MTASILFGKMKKKPQAAVLLKACLVVGLIVLTLTFSACRREEDRPLLDRLCDLEGVTVTEIAPLEGFLQSFQIDVSQPVDHSNPAAGTFGQRFYLSHRDLDKPMVFYTTGYGINRNWESEPAGMLQANQILLVHRYFPDATPEPLDWKYLTIWQAASDQHHIRDLLGDIYQGKWVSGGASKGGMTALYYRRYFPDDVTATVAYVAPIMGQTEDPRFIPFLLEQVGGAECRQKIIDFQRMALERKEALMPLFRAYAQTNGYAFSIIDEESAFDYMVLEYLFAFWQYGQESDCLSIPGSGASDQAVFDHLADVSSPYYYADAGFLNYRPLFYQAYTEIGYCPYVYAHLQDLLQSVTQPSYQAFAPVGVALTFRPQVMQDVIPWLENLGERILYIYGGIDPWSAAMLNPRSGLDALKIVQPGANHMVRIANLDQMELAIQTLERWLEIDITPPQSATPEPAAERKERL